MKNSIAVPQKIKIELPYYPTNPLLGMYPKKPKTLTQKDICILIFIAALFTIAKTWKQPKYPPMDKWIKKFQDVRKYVCTRTHTRTHTKKYIIPS